MPLHRQKMNTCYPAIGKVVLVVVPGADEAKVDGRHYPLMPGHALLIPKGAERAIQCTADTFSYLSLHRRRRGLWPTVRGGDG
jgi:quercetin dioxygenase-like cupin family protein